MKKIIIIGASSGIGEALAIHYASTGAKNLFLCGRNSERLESVAAECRKYQTNVYTKILDQNGKQVSQLATYPITDSDYGKTLSYTNTWATNQATSGDYKAYAEIVNFRKNNEIVHLIFPDWNRN